MRWPTNVRSSRAALLLTLMVLLGMLGVPLLSGLWLSMAAACDALAWQALWSDPQTRYAIALTGWTGLCSAGLATLISARLLSCTSAPQLQRLIGRQAWMLAVPHAAFAIGLALLIAPSGWLLRLVSPWATGLDAPPPWATTQDPWGLGLIAALTLKEIPFLLWAAGTHLLRPDVSRRLTQELAVAATLGYSPQAAWWRVVWPQLLARWTAPMLAVLAYSLSVVDVALVIGPATPPTLGVLAWQWLQDASALENAKGAAAAWLLAGLVATCAAAGWCFLNVRWWQRRRSSGATTRMASAALATRGDISRLTLTPVYLAVLAALALASITGLWPFPDLWPTHWRASAWRAVADSSDTLWHTFWLAASSAGCALVWAVAWLELAPLSWHTRMQALAFAPLVLPGVLWVVGLHRLALQWQLDGTATGVWLAHWLACVPYVLLTLQGAYRSFDKRLYPLAATWGHGRWYFVWHVKWPMMRAALASAFAVGFAVSVAQFLPTLYIGAGRFATVTTEAVTLSSGGQRNLTAAFAWLQWLLPAAVFAGAAWWGRPRRLTQTHSRLGTIHP